MAPPFPDRTAADLKLAIALLLEEAGEKALGPSSPYAAAEEARLVAADIQALVAAIAVLARRRDLFLESGAETR